MPDPWLKPVNAELRGGLREKIIQQTDGRTTILTPRTEVQIFNRPSAFIPFAQQVTETVTALVTVTATETVTATVTTTVTVTVTITPTPTPQDWSVHVGPVDGDWEYIDEFGAHHNGNDPAFSLIYSTTSVNPPIAVTNCDVSSP